MLFRDVEIWLPLSISLSGLRAADNDGFGKARNMRAETALPSDLFTRTSALELLLVSAVVLYMPRRARDKFSNANCMRTRERCFLFLSLPLHAHAPKCHNFVVLCVPVRDATGIVIFFYPFIILQPLSISLSTVRDAFVECQVLTLHNPSSCPVVSFLFFCCPVSDAFCVSLNTSETRIRVRRE